MAESFLFAHQIDQEHLVKTGNRLGIYYYQKGFSLRSSRVLYDRKYSSFYESQLSDYDLDAIIEDMDWLHISGITVALNPRIYDIALALMAKAKDQNIRLLKKLVLITAPVHLEMISKDSHGNSSQMK